MPNLRTLQSLVSPLGIHVGLIALSFTSVFTIHSVSAQVTNPIQPNTPPSLPGSDSETLPPADQILSPPEQTSPLQDHVPNSTETITVQNIEVLGSTIFTQEDFADVLKKYIGKPITFDQLLEARSVITKFYTDRKYLTTGAYLPVQTFQDGGTVKIQVVEGSLEDIQVEGLKRLNASYVRKRIALGAKKPLNLDRLVESIQLLQLNPLIKTISADLSASTQPGLNRLKVQVTEARSLHGQIFLDNNRAPSVGSFRRGGVLTEGNLSGNGDALSVAYASTDGSGTFNASYTYPINARNGTLAFSVDTTNSRVVEPPFDQLDLRGAARSFNLTFRQPIVQKPIREVALGMTLSRQESETSVLGFNFPLSPGANSEGQTRVSAIRFFQDWVQRGQNSVFAARSQFSVGVGAFDATVNEDAPDSQFFAWRGQAQYVRLFRPDFPLILRADSQWSNQPLLTFEQFSLGGQASVRGYRQDSLLTDRGILGSAEVRFPLYRDRDRTHLLQAGPFVDIGTGMNKANTLSDNVLVGMGLGLQYQWKNHLRMRLDYGIPLTATEGTSDRTLQEQGFYFTVTGNPF